MRLRISLIRKFLQTSFVAVLCLFCSATVLADSALNGVLEYKAPPEWSFDKDAKERWLGQDPTIEYRNSVGDSIEVSHYGLEGSEFGTPEDFRSCIDRLFIEPKEVVPIIISGKEATRIKLRYEYGDSYDHDGNFMPAQYIYEEFVILALKKGFLVFILSIRRHEPLPESFLNEEELEKHKAESDYEVSSVLKTWLDFLRSCHIVAEN